ncbi:MAG TPA: choice-of-anchor X domain-containing protein [Terriglobus sp.]
MAFLMPSVRAFAFQASAKSLVIYEVAGAGGLSGANYRQDTIILFNPTSAAIQCAACAIQYHSAGATTSKWTVYKLPSFTVRAGGYYMIAGSAVTLSTSGAVAPIAYDYQLQSIETNNSVSSTQNILSSTSASIALTTNQTALAGGSNASCGATGSTVLDMVGYGSGSSTDSATSPTPATCYEGSGYAFYDGSSGYGRQMGALRSNACVDTNDNTNDFVNTSVVFLNSTSTPTPCPGGTQLSAAITAIPANPSVGGPVTFTAKVMPTSNPASLIASATLRFDSPYYGGKALPMFDDGTHGDAVAGDGTYTLATTIPSTVVPGFVYPTNVTVTDANGDSYTGSTPITATPPGTSTPSATVGNSSLRIVAFYGAGNLSKSMYARDTVILFNPSQQPITMNNWSLQVGGTTGAFSTVYKLPVATVPAGGYYAIAGSGVNYISSSGCVSTICNLNYPYDYQLKTIEGTATDTDNDLSSTGTVLALVSSQTALAGTCPLTAPTLVDLLGVGASDGSAPVTCFAGKGYAPYTPSTTNGAATNVNGVVYAYATVRKNKCTNTFDNAADFTLDYIDFENSQSKPAVCPEGTQLGVTGAISPQTAGVLDPIVVSAQLTAATGSTAINVTADLSNLGLAANAQLYDDGSHGDKTPNDGLYTLATTATTGNPGPVPGLVLNAMDAQGNTARGPLVFTLLAGGVSMAVTSTTASVTAGDVATFPITITSLHGYNGILGITCTGTPNANSLGVPVATHCTSNPSEVSVSPNGTATLSVAIATGLTTTQSSGSSGWMSGLLVMLATLPLLCVVPRGRRIVTAFLLIATLGLTLNIAGCGNASNALADLKAQPGTYTYTVTATDSSLANVTQSIAFTVNVR